MNVSVAVVNPDYFVPARHSNDENLSIAILKIVVISGESFPSFR